MNLFPLLAENQYRLVNVDLPAILPDSLNVASFPVIVLALIAASFAVGILFANAVRMKDYGWKIGLILSTLLVSTFVVLFGNFRLGVDLRGGTILVYEVNHEETAAMSKQGKPDWEMGQLITVIRKRLNPDGLKEIVVRPFGTDQVEIVVPEVDPLEVEKIKELVNTAGVLQFMIVAGEPDDDIKALARDLAEQPPGPERLSREIRDANGERVAYWAMLGREDAPGNTDPAFRALHLIGSPTVMLRGSETGEILELTPQERNLYAGDDKAFKAYLAERGLKNVDVLMKFEEDVDLRGDDLSMAASGFDTQKTFAPCIEFRMTTDGSFKMEYLTSSNIERQLAIIFDSRLLSAATIQSTIDTNGQITGNFQQAEVDFVVGILKSGSMPVVMQKHPTSENQIGSILGRDTIEQGGKSVVVALGLILFFMAIYYRVSGVVAAFALTLNLLMTVAIMVLLQAPFTLPGLAGLVLTVAMSVDANVLISERMKEELAKGATLRMGIRNGFDKALSAIIDGNITTFLTALVLYAIGTDQVRGFGITLMLGNVTSVFTAIFCARVLLDIGERTRWLKTLRMTSFLTNPQVDWVRFFAPAAVGSVILILIGIVATVARGRGLFDIDLAGGTSATLILKESTPEDVVRQKLAGAFKGLADPKTKTAVDHNVYQFRVQTAKPDTVYQVVSSLSSVELLKEKIREAFKQPGGGEGLKTYEMELAQLSEVSTESRLPALSAPGNATPSLGIPPAGTSPPAAPAKTDGAKTGEQPPAATTEKAEKSSDCEPQEAAPQDTGKSEQEKSETTPAPAGKTPADETQPEKTQPKTETPPPGEAMPQATPPATATPAAPGSTEPPLPGVAIPPTPPAPPKVKAVAQVRFPGNALTGFAVIERLQSSAKAVLGRELQAVAKNPNWDGRDNSAFEEWSIEIDGVSQAQAQKTLDHMQQSLEQEVVWQTSNEIGGQVSADTRWRALGALAVSLLGIIAYVWFRFQRVAWGLAAVAALAHDALVMLTAIALSYWFAGALGFLGVEEFKISLSVVAAFLAILGYSVNDTIVIFDRLREIRGKSPVVTRQMLNDAVNQTLSRNIILAGITAAVVLILYAFGGPGIHAFAFAMLAGVISGCYTTLVIAAPLLLWLLNRGAVTTDAKVAKRSGVAAL